MAQWQSCIVKSISRDPAYLQWTGVPQQQEWEGLLFAKQKRKHRHCRAWTGERNPSRQVAKVPVQQGVHMHRHQCIIGRLRSFSRIFYAPKHIHLIFIPSASYLRIRAGQLFVAVADANNVAESHKGHTHFTYACILPEGQKVRARHIMICRISNWFSTLMCLYAPINACKCDPESCNSVPDA